MARTNESTALLALVFLFPFVGTIATRSAHASDPCELDCTNYGGSGGPTCNTEKKSESAACKACESREDARRYGAPPATSAPPPTKMPVDEPSSSEPGDAGPSDEDASPSEPADEDAGG